MVHQPPAQVTENQTGHLMIKEVDVTSRSFDAIHAKDRLWVSVEDFKDTISDIYESRGKCCGCAFSQINAKGEFECTRGMPNMTPDDYCSKYERRQDG